MDKKLKAKWVKALMSGKYEQASGGLRMIDGYCCLGVLGSVCKYRGINDDVFLFGDTWDKRIPIDIQEQLAELNDEGIPFPVIAGFIQENL